MYSLILNDVRLAGSRDVVFWYEFSLHVRHSASGAIVALGAVLDGFGV